MGASTAGVTGSEVQSFTEGIRTVEISLGGVLKCVLFCSMLGPSSYVLRAAVRRLRHLRLTTDKSVG